MDTLRTQQEPRRVVVKLMIGYSYDAPHTGSDQFRTFTVSYPALQMESEFAQLVMEAAQADMESQIALSRRLGSMQQVRSLVLNRIQR